MRKILGLIVSVLFFSAFLSACAPAPTEPQPDKQVNLPSHYGGQYTFWCDSQTQQVQREWRSDISRFKDYFVALRYFPDDRTVSVTLAKSNKPYSVMDAFAKFELETQSYSDPFLLKPNPTAGQDLHDYIIQANLVELANKLDAELLTPNSFTCP